MKNLTPSLNTAFLIAHEHGKPLRWTLAPEYFPRLARIKSLLRSAVTRDDHPGILGMRLVLLDAVPPAALHLIGDQGSRPYSLLGAQALEWSDVKPIRIERRLLSPLTLKLWPLDSDGIASSPPSTLKQSLVDFLLSSTGYQGMADPFKEFYLDATCWFHEALPASLFTHCAGLSTLSALPRYDWIRYETKLALKLEASTEPSDMDITGELLDAIWNSQGNDKGLPLLTKVKGILSTHTSKVDGWIKRDWLTQVMRLQSQSVAAGPKTAMVLAWLANMLENGTLQESNPSADSIKKYFNTVSEPLLTALCQKSDSLNSDDWQPDEMKLAYDKLISESKNPVNARSALSNFHSFLEQYLDVAPLEQPLELDAPPRPVKAKHVWPHEVELACHWAKDAPDVRIGQTAQIMWRVAIEAPVRTDELMRLRMNNVRFGVDAIGPRAEIEIAHHAMSGRIKSDTSQRRLSIRHSEALEQLKNWVLKRQTEGCSLTAYLFGDPVQTEARYRPSQTAAYANRLLRAASGDPEVCFHSLRHTSMSDLTQQAWTSCPRLDINPLEQNASLAGHSSPVTSLKVYSNRYEQGIRLWMNIALEDAVPLSSEEAAPLIGATLSSLRKQASRHHVPLTTYAWSKIRMLDVPAQFERVDAGMTCVQSMPPAAGLASKQIVTPVVMGAVLDDLVKGEALSIICAKFQLDTAVLAKLHIDFLEHCHQIAGRFYPRKFSKQSPPLSLATALERLNIDLRRRHQPKYEPLTDFLSGQGMSNPTIAAALQSWQSCKHGHLISLTRAETGHDLLFMLHKASVRASALRLCIHKSQDPTGELQLRKHRLHHLYSSVFQFPPQFVERDPRTDRPSIYLQWHTLKHQTSLSSASGSTEGLDAWMLCCSAFQIFAEITRCIESN